MGRKKRRKRTSKETETDSDESADSKTTTSSAMQSASAGTFANDPALVENTIVGPTGTGLTGEPVAAAPEYAPETTPEEFDIQRALKGTDTTQDEVPDQVLDVLGSGGQQLEGTIQRALEEKMDADFSNVRIHTGAKAAEAAEAIDAKAFTCGNDVVFNAGEYDPESPEGQYLLAHELAHVKQQTGAAISMMPKADAEVEIDPDPQLEREADEAAAQALSGEEPLIVNRLGTDVHIQRAPNNGERGVVASLAKSNSDLKSDVDTLAEQVEKNRSQLEDLGETVEEALEPPELEELEAELTTEDGSLSERALTHLTELNKAQAGLAGSGMITAGVATSNPVLVGGGLSVALGGPVALNALGDKASGEESVELSGEFLDPLADAVAKRLDERGITSQDQVEGRY